MDRKEIGKLGEKMALEYLTDKGYTILARNYRVGRLGEIDLIASFEGSLSFIEVKTRTGNAFGTPAEAVTWKKQMTIRQVASCFLKAHGVVDMPVQFDIIEVMMTKEGRLINLQYLEKVF
jgi:putative endonuclease